MSYILTAKGWYCQFLEENLKTPIPCKLTFAFSDKVVELIERTGALRNLECRQAVENSIIAGRGEVWLMVTLEQYRKLQR